VVSKDLFPEAAAAFKSSGSLYIRRLFSWAPATYFSKYSSKRLVI